ncbi:hypothetical protein F511_42425 [Dorcoceras hygrometricum]|uniref:Uncharacterized protein n=1 Tax=Dorcoceras hygrometricum TaxID=472368 RepID=A0A2Z7A947_9LAMI|nr:hypothetical protein F511_42425 [Dorcoceras hygrometricum]
MIDLQIGDLARRILKIGLGASRNARLFSSENEGHPSNRLVRLVARRILYIVELNRSAWCRLTSESRCRRGFGKHNELSRMDSPRQDDQNGVRQYAAAAVGGGQECKVIEFELNKTENIRFNPNSEHSVQLKL